jgi:sulfur relay (sulfurtransferase) DsrC/TusE family protein
MKLPPTINAQLSLFQSKRRMPDWQPKPAAAPSHAPIEEKWKQVLWRCLDFVDLEMQVKEWVIQTTNKELKANEDEAAAIKENLLRNSRDEEKHDEVLRYLRTYYLHPSPSPQAMALIRRWKNLEDHPITAAYGLECGVFFTILPLLIKKGDVYAATVGQWINDDERVHVETNLALMKHLGLKLTKPLLQLIYDTNHFLFEPIGKEEAVKQAERAVKRTISGKDPLMLEESLPTTLAFFEQHNKLAITY